MGNGFTFELESLIFLTIGLAVCEYLGEDDAQVAIFGDDLIIPSKCVTKLTHICTILGFTINTRKTFSTGNFRESCGAYYFMGVDVKPLFLKERLYFLKDVYRLANGIRTFSHIPDYGCDSRFRPLWRNLVNNVPKRLRFFGPKNAGDACISVSPTETRLVPHREMGRFYLSSNPDGTCFSK
jgi:hypothetical protein